MRTITSSYEDVQIGYKFGNRMSLTSSRRLTMRTCKILVNRRKSCRKIESSDVYLTQILKKDFDFVSGLIYLFTSFFKSIGMLSTSLGNVQSLQNQQCLTTLDRTLDLYIPDSTPYPLSFFFYNLKSFLKSFPNNLSFPVRTQCCFDVHTTSF